MAEKAPGRARESNAVEVRGRVSGEDLPWVGDAALQSVLHCTARDDAAMYGVVELLRALGLHLVELRQHAVPSVGEGDSGDAARARDVEIVVDGALGELALSTVADCVEVTGLATRILHLDPERTRSLLTWAEASGVEVHGVAAEAGSGPYRVLGEVSPRDP
jgi:hypothetical protein